MSIGIEKLDLYAGQLALPLVALAEARGRDTAYPATKIQAEARTVLPPYEDAVTLAVNAAKRVLAPEDVARIALLVVATESAVDQGKPISTWVHRLCGLPSSCRNFEVKHACYGGTAALHTASAWLAAHGRPGAKALVIATDHSRAHVGAEIEFICGAAAVAMVLGREPGVAALEPGNAGAWSDEIADTFRPTLTAEIGDNQASLFSYMDALEGAFAAYEEAVGPVDVPTRFAGQVYHTPFPAMAFQAHRTLLRRNELPRASLAADFDARVAPGLWLARQVGGAYSASIFVNLLGLLSARPELAPGDRLGIFSYGSGCQAEFFELTVGPEARARVQALGLRERLAERTVVPVKAYEAFEAWRAANTGARDARPLEADPTDTYGKAYAGRGLLVLAGVDDHRRSYTWS